MKSVDFHQNDPEWIRASQVQSRFSISRSSLYNWRAAGMVQSRVIKRPGYRSGIRLWNVESIRAVIEGAGEPVPAAA